MHRTRTHTHIKIILLAFLGHTFFLLRTQYVKIHYSFVGSLLLLFATTHTNRIHLTHTHVYVTYAHAHTHNTNSCELKRII